MPLRRDAETGWVKKEGLATPASRYASLFDDFHCGSHPGTKLAERQRNISLTAHPAYAHSSSGDASAWKKNSI